MMNRSIRAQSNFINAQKLQEVAQISSLQQNVQILATQNKQKYSSILSSEPNYDVALYQPKDGLKNQKLFKKQLLLKQLDRLMDQQSIFDKKITQINVLKQMQSQQIEIVVEREVNPYLSLRSAWSKHQIDCTDLKGSDRLQSLNFTIGVIKNTVLAMKNVQQHYQPSYLYSNDYLQAQKLQKLQLKYERSCMINQELRQQVHFLHQKLQQKQQKQRQIANQLYEKEKEIISLKKTIQTYQVSHKIMASQLQQKIFNIENSLQKVNKWKQKLEKNQYKNIEGTFKLYLETTEIQVEKKNQPKCKATSKNLSQIQIFLSQQSQAATKSVFLNPEEYQNHQIIIPTLTLTQNDQQTYTRRKIYTQRVLKVKNFQFQKFVGKRLFNLKYKRNALDLNINDETAKKFVRKGQILGSNRQIDYQFSQRIFKRLILKEADKKIK